MTRIPEKRQGRARASPRRPAAPAKARRGGARRLARNTLAAAGLLIAQFSGPEIDANYPIFNRGLVDKLHAPITRIRE